jgi:uncharacterized integral membrane protein (TIGR00697 family)
MKTLIRNPEESARQPHKYLSIFGMIWVSVLIMSTFTSLKTFYINDLVFTVGVIIYPLVYIFADIFTEVYGYRVTRKIVWTGFACSLFVSMVAYLYTLIPNPSFEHDAAYNLIFRAAPIIALGAFVANTSGEFINSFILAKMKLLWEGKYLNARLVASTLFGQLVDNSIFFFVAIYFAGWYGLADALPLLISTVLFCTIWEVIALPVTRRVIAFVKNREGIDTYDYDTRFSPFSLKS